MFECPSVLLSLGSQRFFTKVIRMLKPRPNQKSTFINLDHIRCSVEEISKYLEIYPISETLQCLSREFLWKRLNNTFRVGDFWSHIDTQDMKGYCRVCNVPERLEHIALECDMHGEKLIWNITQQLWLKKYRRSCHNP
ncbi:hypothetical protein C8R44DRAFT_652970 [Mycena epipterygia]|nr:hypothetical protein C8R44DRAFT_652970 [Mycena epipterygia]